MSTTKQKTIHEKFETIQEEIAKRPTFTVIISISLTGLALLVTIVTFMVGKMLDANTKQVIAETRLVVNTCMTEYSDKEEARWDLKEDGIIKKVLAMLSPYNKGDN